MNSPVADLKDIHIPAEPGWSPPAYGWWLVTLLVLTLIICLSYYLVKRHRLNLAKRQALQQLAGLSASSANWPLDLNSLLKRVVQTYQPQAASQALYGEAWVSLLSQALPTKKQADFSQKMRTFQNALYQPQAAQQLDFAEYQALVKDWIKQARLSSGKLAVGSVVTHSDHGSQGGLHV